MVVAHDLDLVRAHFPHALLLARAPIAWGDAREALTPENLLRARRFHEAWDEDAPGARRTKATATPIMITAAVTPGMSMLRRAGAAEG
jgi:zinc/manganese transport system ATP-binding protein